MKRILFFLLAAVLVVGGGLTAILLSDTPQKAVQGGLSHLVAMQGAQEIQLNVSWTDSKTKATTGFTYTGALDLRDLLAPNTSGLLRVGAGVQSAIDQTGDVVALGDQVELRPRSVGPEWRAVYQRFVGITTTTQPYVRFDRDTLLLALDPNFPAITATSSDMRRALAFFPPVAAPQGDLMQANTSLGMLDVVDFTLDRNSFDPFLYNLLKAWYGRNPTAEELVLVDRLMQSAGAGTYRMAVTKDTRLPVELDGQFPYLGADMKPTTVMVHFTLGLQGVGELPSITLPPNAVDASLGLTGAQADLSLPSAANATGTHVGLSAIGAQPTIGQIVNNKQIDLYDTYIDTLRKIHNAPVK